jgi:hypothetical protein
MSERLGPLERQGAARPASRACRVSDNGGRGAQPTEPRARGRRPCHAHPCMRSNARWGCLPPRRIRRGDRSAARAAALRDIARGGPLPSRGHHHAATTPGSRTRSAICRSRCSATPRASASPRRLVTRGPMVCSPGPRGARCPRATSRVSRRDAGLLRCEMAQPRRWSSSRT